MAKNFFLCRWCKILDYMAVYELDVFFIIQFLLPGYKSSYTCGNIYCKCQEKSNKERTPIRLTPRCILCTLRPHNGTGSGPVTVSSSVALRCWGYKSRIILINLQSLINSKTCLSSSWFHFILMVLSLSDQLEIIVWYCKDGPSQLLYRTSDSSASIFTV